MYTHCTLPHVIDAEEGEEATFMMHESGTVNSQTSDEGPPTVAAAAVGAVSKLTGDSRTATDSSKNNAASVEKSAFKLSDVDYDEMDVAVSNYISG